MGDSTALQKAKLDADRQQVKARVSRLRTRLADDRDTLVEEGKELVRPASRLAAEHPVGLVGASAAAGFVAGLVPAPDLPKPDMAVPSPVKKVAGKGASVGADVLKVEAAVVMKDFVNGLFDVDHAPPDRSR